MLATFFLNMFQYYNIIMYLLIICTVACQNKIIKLSVFTRDAVLMFSLKLTDFCIIKLYWFIGKYFFLQQFFTFGGLIYFLLFVCLLTELRTKACFALLHKTYCYMWSEHPDDDPYFTRSSSFSQQYLQHHLVKTSSCLLHNSERSRTSIQSCTLLSVSIDCAQRTV